MSGVNTQPILTLLMHGLAPNLEVAGPAPPLGLAGERRGDAAFALAEPLAHFDDRRSAGTAPAPQRMHPP
jgi:hypothetical protein